MMLEMLLWGWGPLGGAGVCPLLKKSPRRNTGALCGDPYHRAGVTAAGVARPASAFMPEHCNDDK